MLGEYEMSLKQTVKNVKQVIKIVFFRLFYKAKPNELLLENPDIYIDREFFDIFLKGQFFYYAEQIMLPLKELRLEFGDEGFISSSPVYKYLTFPEIEQKRTKNLQQDILKNGYESSSVIVVSEFNRVLDGQHRSCVLMSVYGGEYPVRVLRLYRKKYKRRFFGVRETKTAKTYYFFGLHVYKKYKRS